jgi:hypothetical protein
MAEELGLEYTPPVGGEAGGEAGGEVVDEVVDEVAVEVADEVQVKESTGFTVGLSPSLGIISGESFTSIPVGATLVITTPYSLDLGPLKYTVSLALGGYTGKYDSGEVGAVVDNFNPAVAALGGNLNLFNLVFAEGHVGMVGKGQGFRGFAGVSMEKILKKGLDLPFNLLVGSELFVTNDISGAGNSSGWVSLGARLDFDI